MVIGMDDRYVVFIAGGGALPSLCADRAARGEYVVFTYGLDGEDESASRSAIERAGGECAAYRAAEMTSEELSAALVDTADRMGRIDEVIYCAEPPSGGNGHDDLMLDLDEQDVERAIRRGPVGLFLVCKYALPYMLGRPGAKITVIAPPVIGDGGHNIAGASSIAALDEMIARLSADLAMHGVKAERADGI